MEVQLKIDNAMLADYLRYLFPSADGGTLKVTSEHGLGKLIIAHCREMSRPPEYGSGDNIGTLRLPLCRATQNLENKFLYYSATDMVQLNQALAAYFDLDFTGYYRRGQGAKFSKSDIIQAFIVSRRLVSDDYFDALSKRMYRRQQEEIATITRKLRRRAYYLDEVLDTTGLEKNSRKP